MKKLKYKSAVKICALCIACLCAGCVMLSGCSGGSAGEDETTVETGKLTSPEDIDLRSGDGVYYVFTYKGQDYKAEYWPDNWKIYDSCMITDSGDIRIICQALIDEHPVHGKDMESFRTAEDMEYEWKQHNLAYKYLPEDNEWRESARNVDLDPQDQGRSIKEIYEDRTGKELHLSDFLK